MNIHGLILIMVITLVAIKAICEGRVVEYALFFLVGIEVVLVCFLIRTLWKWRERVEDGLS